jgi:hypothetical protein
MIWAGLHFPFHMSLVLLMEGINQLFVWGHILEDLIAEFMKLANIPDDASDEEAIGVLNNVTTYVFNTFPSTEDVYQQTQDAFAVFDPTNDNITEAQAEKSFSVIITNIGKVIFDGLGWEVSETEGEGAGEGGLQAEFNHFFDQYLQVFSISFGESHRCTGFSVF